MELNKNKIKRGSIVIGLILLIYFFSQKLLITKYFNLTGLSLREIYVFEKYFVQFIFGFIGIAILSRGQLWSYGINSSYFFKTAINIIFYATIALIFYFLENPISPGLNNNQNKIFYWLVNYLAIPISNIVFYIGFLQNYFVRDIVSQKINLKYVEILTYSFVLIAFFINTIFVINFYGYYFSQMNIVVVLFSAIFYNRYNSIFIPLIGSVIAFMIYY